MIKRALQLAGAGLNYALMFSVGFVLTFMAFCGLIWAVDTLLEFVTVANPVYNGWFHTSIVVAGLIMSLVVGIIFLGNEEKERRKYSDCPKHRAAQPTSTTIPCPTWPDGDRDL